MRKIVPMLFYVSRVLAITALLAGLAAGLYVASVIAAFTCFDSCPTPDTYFSHVFAGTIWVMTPCVTLATLGALIFLGYCLTTHQTLRILRHIVVFVVGGLVGAVALFGLLQLGQANLPVTAYGLVAEKPAEMGMVLWGLSLMFIAGAWSGALALLQWPPDSEQRRLPSGTTSSMT